MNAHEIKSIATRLGIPLKQFHADYLREYPLRPDSYLINRRDGVCVFLMRRGTHALCSVHDVKPEACKAWIPSLSRKECRDGLRKLGAAHWLSALDDLDMPEGQLDESCRSLQDTSDYSIMHRKEILSQNE